MSSEPPGVVILGATSAIARAIAHEYALRGWSVILAARDTEENDANARDLHTRYQTEVHSYAWDAADMEGHGAFAAKCIETLGRCA